MTLICKAALSCAPALAIASLCFGATTALAQEDVDGTVRKQLDRIEQKLDRLLERLDTTSTTDAPVRAGATMLRAPEDKRPATAAPAPAVVDETESSTYKPGAVAIAHVAPERTTDLAEIPADSVGSFVYIGGAIPLSELSRSGVRYDGLTAIELQGWLKVAEPGRTQFSVEYRATTGSNVFTNPACIASIWLEDRSIGSKRAEIPMPAREEKTAFVILGADLQPGLYRMRAWLACMPPRDLRKLNAELLIKTPSDANLRMIDDKDLLHQGG